MQSQFDDAAEKMKMVIAWRLIAVRSSELRSESQCDVPFDMAAYLLRIVVHYLSFPMNCLTCINHFAPEVDLGRRDASK